MLGCMNPAVCIHGPHVLQDVRYYVTPANNSADGCVCEKMSAGGGPTLADERRNFPSPDQVSTDTAAALGSEAHGGVGAEDDAWRKFMKAKFEELLSPVRVQNSYAVTFHHPATSKLSMGLQIEQKWAAF
jgi:hypothetical protein